MTMILINGEPSEAHELPVYHCALCGTECDTDWIDTSLHPTEIAISQGSTRCTNPRCVNRFNRAANVLPKTPDPEIWMTTENIYSSRASTSRRRPRLSIRRPRWYEWLALDLGAFLAIIFGGPYGASTPTWAAVLLMLGLVLTALPLGVFVLAIIMSAID